MKGSFVLTLFQKEPVGTFADGHVVINAPEIGGAEHDPRSGYWRCDIANHDALTWSEMVYELFGLPAGTSVTRDWAVARYADASKAALERVRTYALDRKLGFILDAVIHVEEGDSHWIRVLAIPILAKRSGRIVGLHGLKRHLEQIG